jgi:hypothetical protein
MFNVQSYGSRRQAMAHDFDEILNAVRTAIDEDPTITDTSKIAVSAEQEGRLFRKEMVIQLEGTVRMASEVAKVAEIVRRKAPRARIENDLRPMNTKENV